MADEKDGMTGRDLQESQSGIGSAERGPIRSEGQSRTERYDERANGGRGPESVSPDDDEIARDQQAHQDRGQSEAEADFEREQS